MQTYVSINLDKLCTVRLLFARADVSMYATGYFYCLYCHFFNPAFFPTLFIFFNVQTLLGELAVSICHFKLQHSSTVLFSRTEFENLGYFKSNLQKLSLYYLGLRNQSFNLSNLFYIAMMCPANSHYEPCMSRCPPTCAEPNPGPCVAVCVEGCQCNDGFILSNKRCVRRKDCGCYKNGHYYRVSVKLSL